MELIVNGQPVARKNLVADGQVRTMEFDVPIGEQLGRVAHFTLFAHQSGVRPRGRQADSRIAAQRRVVPCRCESVLDAEGAQDAANQLEEARKAYDHARQVYRQRVTEAVK